MVAVKYQAVHFDFKLACHCLHHPDAHVHHHKYNRIIKNGLQIPSETDLMLSAWANTLGLCVQSSLLCQRLNYSLGVCLQALSPCRVGFMPAMLGLVCVVVWIDPQPQSRAQHWPTSCCKHLRHHTAAWVPVCIYIVFMGIRQTTAQNRTSLLNYSTLDMIKKTCFMRLPTADSLDELINLQMPCCVFHLYSCSSVKALVLLFIMTDAETISQLTD